MNRFDKAVSKLYKAFSEGSLNAFHCRACAVGNICDNEFHWSGYEISMFDKDNFNSFNSEFYPQGYDYTPQELRKIEFLFLREFTIAKPGEGYLKHGRNKQAQYNGLMAVIDYLAELDGIEVPDLTKEMFKNELVDADDH